MYDNLFSPIQIGELTIANRIAMMAMGVSTPRLMNARTGAYTKEGADYYIERARGGAGLIVTGLVSVAPMTATNPVNHPEEYVEEMRYLTSGVHQYGAKLFVQLTARTGRSVWVSTQEEADELPSPSRLPNAFDPTIMHPAITREEIHTIVDNYAKAAHLVKQAGGDGVEIHAVHEGYLLDQFSMSFFNKRTDEYGGSLENRLRILKEIVSGIKKACGKGFPVAIRYSVRSYIKDFNRGALPGEEFTEKGRDLAEGIEAAKLLESYGYDMLDCDNGSYDSWFWAHPPVYMPKACNFQDVAAVKKAVGIPVVCAGRFDDPQMAEEAIAAGQIDMMGMARPFLADPEIVRKFREGRLSDVRPCISCHQGCFGRIFQGKDISCAVNPLCGREKTYAIEPAPVRKRVLVAGGGLSGMEAARVCALRGHQVTLCEQSGQLGGVFIAASMPDFKADERRLLEWYRKQMRDLNVDVRLYTTVTEDLTSGYDEIFVAAGSRERRLDFDGADSSHVTYAVDTLCNPQITGANLLVVGGGLTGCEIACQYAKEGKQVTIAEAADNILNVFGLCAANYNMLMEMLDYYHVRVLKNAEITGYRDGMAQIRLIRKNAPNTANRAKTPYMMGSRGTEKLVEIPADHIVISVGYLPRGELYNRIKGNHVYLIGDAKQPGNIMEAIWTAYDIAREV